MQLRTLELVGLDPAAHGEQHGEAFRDSIREIYAIRLRLMLERTDLGREENVLALAKHHLPVLEEFNSALHAELCGIARGAGLSAEQLVVLNHYTDLRDLSLRDLQQLDAGHDPGGCSAWLVDDGQKNGERFVGQTWDMHGSATPYALLLTVPHARGRQTFFTITGCLGMTGLSSWGTALTINNLNSLDASVGVVWPAMVRACVAQPTARDAYELAMRSKIGSGRHYIFADDHEAFAIETSGTKKKQVWHRRNEAASWFHTNHCVDDEMKPTTRILPTSTTVARYDTLQKREQTSGAPSTPAALYAAFADVSMPFQPSKPDDVATCGAIVMDIRRRQVMACVGEPLPDSSRVIVQL
jgi:isopenicillin-N N-acyltransferase-like protein